MEGLRVEKELNFNGTFPDGVYECFDKYEEMQKKHLKILETDINPDIEFFNFERSGTFESLKNELTVLINHSKGKDDDTIAGDVYKLFINCRARISAILQRDDVIFDKIKTFKNEISAHMKTIHRGRKAITGYAQFNV